MFESGRKDAAALSSRTCASIYGLDCLKESVQDQGNNYTRFICISKKLEIYPGADKTSVMMVLPPRPGSLYRVLSRFYAWGLTLLSWKADPCPTPILSLCFTSTLKPRCTPTSLPSFLTILRACA